MGQADITRQQQTILLVDDDSALRGSLEFILGIEGYTVRAYARGRELLDDTNLPDKGCCLVIDQRLPDIEGLKLIDALRARSVELPAILVTTNPSRALRRRAEEANVTIVEKPFLTGALFQRIGAALDSGRSDPIATRDAGIKPALRRFAIQIASRHFSVRFGKRRVCRSPQASAAENTANMAITAASMTIVSVGMTASPVDENQSAAPAAPCL